MSSSTIAKDAALLESIDTSSTMDLHRSNLLRLQVAELLEECQLDLHTRKWATDAQEYLQILSKMIPKMDLSQKKTYQDRADKPISVSTTSRLSVEPIGCTKSPVGWTKKSGNAQVLPTFDLMVQLPSDIFSGKDYLNYRYFDKRNLIIDSVAKHLASPEHCKKLGSVEYIWSKGTDRAPYLQLIPPSKKNAPKFQVHLHFGMQSNQWISKLRLAPNRCNIKDEFTNHPTSRSQLYNHCLLYDSRHEYEDSHLHDLVDHTNVQATLVLIQVWALQRGLWRNHDGWTRESVALLLVYLLRTHKMNARMTPIQLFTVVLQTWATTNWLGDGEKQQIRENNVRAAHSHATQFQGNDDGQRRRTILVLPSEGGSEKDTIQQSDFAGLYQQQTRESPLTQDDPPTLMDAYSGTKCYLLGPVFLDPTMTYNYLGDVSANYMRVLQAHAQKSLEGLKKSRSAFGFLFMNASRFWSQWDIYVQIPIVDEKKDSSPDEWEFSTRQLISTLETALGNRIHGMRVLSSGNGETGPEKYSMDSDQYPNQTIGKKATYKRPLVQSPTGSNKLVLGISINPETSLRVVDRGPPSDDHKEVKAFVKLWGNKAELRRFKDGAIVQAVIWNDDNRDGQFQNDAKLNGGYVEKIVRHIVQLHYTKESIQFSLPNLLSVVDGVTCEDKSTHPFIDPMLAHQNMMKAFEFLSDFLRKNSQQPLPGSLETSRLGLPLAIDGVEPLSPCLRYSELFPPVPHPFLGSTPVTSSKKVSGALVSDPILIQIRFGSSSKWPSDLKAIGAAKTAMLIQLANGIETSGEKGFDGPILVTPSYAELGYKGYCFRILVRADPEIKMLQGLVKPSPVAATLFKELTRRHLIASRHHYMIHAVHTFHPSAGSVVRIAKRWVASHLLSGLITDEAIELMVAKVYSDGEASLEAPGTVMAGFLRFLRLLATHDWTREPLVVNPRDHINDDEYDAINHQFEEARGANMDLGPPMYIIAPYDKTGIDDEETQNAVQVAKDSSWHPSVSSPEWVVLTRAVALAKRSYAFMSRCLVNFDESAWSAVFHESAGAFKSYNVLFRVNSDFIVDPDSSSTGGNLDICANDDGILESAYTRSMKTRVLGPKALRRRLYRNLRAGTENGVLSTWQPVQSVVSSLRDQFGQYALFFYNELSPEVIGLVWRPQTYSPMPFSVMTSDYAQPTEEENWKPDSLVMRNASDLLREMKQYNQDVCTTVKIFDTSYMVHRSKKRRLSQDRSHDIDDEESSVSE